MNKLIKCECCGGLCAGHFQDPTNKEINCWGCCADGCRGCNSTGYVPIEYAIKISRLTIEKLTNKIRLEEEKLKKECLKFMVLSKELESNAE